MYFSEPITEISLPSQYHFPLYSVQDVYLLDKEYSIKLVHPDDKNE